MASRRQVLATLSTAGVQLLTAGCLSRTRGANRPGDDGDARPPEPDDLSVESTSAEDYSPEADAAEEEAIRMTNLSVAPVSMNGVVVEYPDGYRYALGTEIPLVLESDAKLRLHTASRETLVLQSAPPIHVRGADHPDPPALTGQGAATVYGRDGQTLARTDE